MQRRAVALSLALLSPSLACSRSTEQQPKAVAEVAADAAPPTASAAPGDAGARTPPAPASPLSIVARLPIAHQAVEYSSREVSSALPLVQRLPGGGLFVASEYAHARADGAGPLAVTIDGRGLERDAAYRFGEVQGGQGLRWVWADAAGAVVSNEEATMRSGPRLASFRLGPKGFTVTKQDVGYWSAVVARDSVLALERVAYVVPGSSIYAKGSPDYADGWGLKPARVAVLAGKTPAPIIPPKVCALAMAAAPDGTVAIAVDKCEYGVEGVGILRYPPGVTRAAIEWLPQPPDDDAKREIGIAVGGESDVHVSFAARLTSWNGKAWTDGEAPGRKTTSLSRAPDGTLWAASGGKLLRRAPDAKAWTEVPLPPAPAEPLEREPYGAPGLTGPFRYLRGAAADWERPRGADAGAPLHEPAALQARTVDAAGDDVLVLAHAEREGFVLSTKARTPVAVLPSITTQRARVVQAMKPSMMTPKTVDCRFTFLMFPDGTTAETIRSKVEIPPASAGDDEAIGVGEAIVEGTKRIVVFGLESEVVEAAKKLAPLAPKRACDPPVIERIL